MAMHDIAREKKMKDILVDNVYQLKKFPGKGGWTYAAIPEVLPDKKAHFGWVKVQGSIDSYTLTSYRLMPMGDGSLFLPVKAAIRKIIGKKAGDFVKITLYKDENPIAVPDEIIACLKNEHSSALHNFLKFTDSEKKVYLDWIYAAKKEETRADRIVKMIDRVMLNKKFYDTF